MNELARIPIQFNLLLLPLDGERYQDDQLSHLVVILESCSAKWKEIGVHLSFHMGELENIEAKPHLMMSAPRSYLNDMLTQWLHWGPRDRRGSVGFATREELRRALRKAGLGALSENLPPGL